jgi:hypothetical protein
LKLVSSPIHTKATLNKVLLNPLEIFPRDFASSGEKNRLKTRDATINPRTNLGNLSHNNLAEGFLFSFFP